MKAKYNAVRGTRDLIGKDARRLLAVERSLGDWCSSFGYEPILTPVFEEEALFTRSIGDATDVVRKEIYQFTDKKGRKLALRPEGTAGVCRALVQSMKLAGAMTRQRYFYSGPMFRYDRPQAGRYRQFSQFGVECFCESGPYVDAEQVYMIDSWLRQAGLADHEVRVNSIGCPACRGGFTAALQERWRGHADELCGDCRERIEKNPLRVLDCKVPDCYSQRGEVPAAEKLLCACCAGHFQRFKGFLEALEIKYRQDDRLVRGLDYYTQTTFEFVSTALGAQSAFLGGGRYDGLISQLGGPSVPAIGWAVGLDRLLALVPPELANFPRRYAQGAGFPAGCCYMAFGSGEAEAKYIPVIIQLLKSGIDVHWPGKPEKIGKQLKDANNFNAVCVIIVHENEVQGNAVQFKNFKTGDMVQVAWEAGQSPETFAARLAEKIRAITHAECRS